MLQNITYYPILGRPLIMWLGIVTISSFLFTASIAIMNKKGITAIPFKWHPRMAYVSIGLALMHGLLGILAYL